MRYRTPTLPEVIADARNHDLLIPLPWASVGTGQATGIVCWVVHGWLAELRYEQDKGNVLDVSPHNAQQERPWRGLRLDTLLHGLEQQWDSNDIFAAQILDLSPVDCQPLDRVAGSRQELVARFKAKVEFRRTLKTLLALQRGTAGRSALVSA